MEQRRRNTTIWQILFWGGFWVLVPFLLTGGAETPARFLVRNAVVLAGIAFVVLINLEVLLPRLYFQKRQVWYILAGIGLVALVVLVVEWREAPWAEYIDNLPDRFRSRPRRNPDRYSWRVGMRYFTRAIPFFTAFLGSALYEISNFANQKEKEAIALRNEKLEAEMKFLKSQINPHFLFNALNNIYTLTVIKSDAAPENLLRLSEMLRYMLYDCRADRVPLKKEIAYIRNFVDLQLLKDSRGLRVDVDLDESRPDLAIAPLLFVPFIENAFKHSKIEDLDHGWIKIRLTTKEREVLFEVANSLPAIAYSKDEVGGIGLENIRRQLELLYPGKHRLDIEKQPDQFKVNLKIDLS